jgi:hypothetical protein
MKYVFRAARPSDFPLILADSTENGKVDQSVIDGSDEIRVMECDGQPIMAIGCITYKTGVYEDMLGVWAVIHKDVKKHVRAAVRFCDDLIFSRVATKFVVLIDETNPKFKRFVEFFGFQRTKVVERHGETVYHIYVKEN